MKDNKKLKKKIITWIITVAVILAALVGVIIYDRVSNKVDVEITLDEAQRIVDDTFAKLPKNVALSSKKVFENSFVKVNSISYGTEKDIILDCTYSTLDIGSVIEENINKYLSEIYVEYIKAQDSGKMLNATAIMIELSNKINADLDEAEKLTGEVQLYLYQLGEDNVKLYLSDEAINTCFGNIIAASKLIKDTKDISIDGETISISNLNTLRTGLSDCIALTNYDASKPDTGTTLEKAWNSFANEFHRNFIQKAQWTYLTNGLLTTLQITFFALLLGIVIGFLVAIIRVTNHKTGKLGFLSGICKLYLSVIRGTPVMVQLLIIYFVLLLPIGVEKMPAAILCFGLNSGAYVSEIVRGGIMSVDAGQTEAGRSLGFNYPQTMWHIVIPQAFKAVLPALANEFITLLKESSVAFYIGVADLTQGGLKIRSITYSNFMPLVAVALIYLVVVLGLSYCVGLLEKRLNKSDR